ncbi:MAG: polysaccharide deacetylase family protein [Acidobacteria bacterium]|nr:polysaccharide deacetylase family protein [Acidobacteriota bacterium]
MDIEPDYSPVKSGVRRYALLDDERKFLEFIELLNTLDIPLTCFVVSESLRDRPDAIAELERNGAEFACHSMSHDLFQVGSEREVRGGIEGFTDFFGHRPFAYRTPQARLNRSILQILEREQVWCDSSIVPSYRPGVYSNLHSPVQPFRWQSSKIVEIPIGVLPRLRIPVSLSYLKLLGPWAWGTLSRICGLPNPLVFLSHPMDFEYSSDALATLSHSMRFAYLRNQERSLELFRLFIQRLNAAGYTLMPMSKVFESISRRTLPQVPLPRH